MPKGICYVETKNLDGETNLKHKEPAKVLYQLFKDEERLKSFNGEVECEEPNDKLYSFEGKLTFEEGKN